MASSTVVTKQDVSSLSNHTAVASSHMDIAWHIDFAAQKLSGSVVHRMATAVADVATIAFDAKGLSVSKVAVSIDNAAEEPVAWAASAEANDALGQGVTLTLPQPIAAPGTQVAVRIEYATVPDACLALCWLDKAQTESGTHPFMYSQCQAIHCRTILPCQDTPAVRTTYSACVTTSTPGVKVLMSALVDTAAAEGTFSFSQQVPIASYLIAIAAGNIAGKDVSERCRVYAEPTSVEKAAWEFAEVEDILKVAESIAGPYEWGRYDLLVLPPSFPFGGMENPNLTFVTPTCITGDRSLVELVAHEICHSWSGNLIGIASWADFWINEGFTTILQRMITQRMHGDAVADFEAGTGIVALEEDVKLYGAEHPFTALVPTLARDVDPDDAFSSVPYEKGFVLLKHLESLVGADAFARWIKDVYVPTHRRRSIHSADVKDCFTRSFPEQAKQVAWDAAFYDVGMPKAIPEFSVSLRAECNAAADAIIAADDEMAKKKLESADFPNLRDAAAKWQGRQHVAFLERFHAVLDARPADPAPATLSAAALGHIDAATGYSNNYANNEVAASWYALCLRSRGQYTRHMPAFTSFLGRVGRMKFVRPLFRAWAAFDLPAASAHYEASCTRYHAITRKMTQQDFAKLQK